MKTLKRCHGVDLQFLHERLSDIAGDGPGGTNTNRDPCDLQDCVSSGMAADIFTKAFTNKEKWDAACALINIVDTGNVEDVFLNVFNSIRTSNALKLDHSCSPEEEPPSAEATMVACTPCEKRDKTVTHADSLQSREQSTRPLFFSRPPRNRLDQRGNHRTTRYRKSQSHNPTALPNHHRCSEPCDTSIPPP